MSQCRTVIIGRATKYFTDLCESDSGHDVEADDVRKLLVVLDVGRGSVLRTEDGIVVDQDAEGVAEPLRHLLKHLAGAVTARHVVLAKVNVAGT